MVAALGGLDALVFTGGVGEGSPQIRAMTCRGLGFPGIELDETRNQVAPDADVDLAPDGADVRVVVRAREDLEIASEARRVTR